MRCSQKYGKIGASPNCVLRKTLSHTLLKEIAKLSSLLKTQVRPGLFLLLYSIIHRHIVGANPRSVGHLVFLRDRMLCPGQPRILGQHPLSESLEDLS